MQGVGLNLALSSIAVLALAAMPVCAEPFPLTIVAAPNLPENVRDSLQLLVRRHANGMYACLQEEIERLDESCDLSDEQRSRLLLASKGAVQDSLEAWLGPIQSALAHNTPGLAEILYLRLQQVNLEGRQALIRNGAVIVVQERVMMAGQEVIRARAVPAGARLDAQVLQEANSLMLELDESRVLQHEIYRGTLQTVLTAEQREILEQLDAVSPESVTRSGRLVMLLAAQLSLSPDQRRQVRDLIGQIKDVRVREWIAGRSRQSSLEIANIAALYLPRAQMEKILSPVQFRLWRQFVEQSLQVPQPALAPVAFPVIPPAAQQAR